MNHSRIIKATWTIGLALFGGLSVSLIVIGCASIMHGARQDISVTSVPLGAKVTVNGVNMGATPSMIRLDRAASSIALVFTKEGYEPVTVALNRRMDGWLLGNIILGGLIGLAIDFATGSAYRLSPKEVNVVLSELKKQGANIDKLSKDSILIAVDLRSLEESNP